MARSGWGAMPADRLGYRCRHGAEPILVAAHLRTDGCRLSREDWISVALSFRTFVLEICRLAGARGDWSPASRSPRDRPVLDQFGERDGLQRDVIVRRN